MTDHKNVFKEKASAQQRTTKLKHDKLDDETGTTVTQEERHQLIAMTAYFIAEKRGFQGDAALDDWLHAEAEVDTPLGTNTEY